MPLSGKQMNRPLVVLMLQKTWKSFDETQFLLRLTALLNCLNFQFFQKTVMTALTPEIVGKECFLYTVLK